MGNYFDGVYIAREGGGFTVRFFENVLGFVAVQAAASWSATPHEIGSHSSPIKQSAGRAKRARLAGNALELREIPQRGVGYCADACADSVRTKASLGPALVRAQAQPRFTLHPRACAP